MKSYLILSLGILGAFFASGCSHGNCRDQGRSPSQSADANKPAAGDIAVKPTDRVRVYKYDGSLQCNQGKPISTQDMQKELKGIEVFSAENKRDSVMRAQRCGLPTGNANVFEIARKDLDQAKKLGFQLWTFE